VFKVLILLKRNPGMTMAEFIDYYENHHAPLGYSFMTGVRRYVRRYLSSVDGSPDADLPFDAVTELWFDDRGAFDKAMAGFADPDVAGQIARDEENLFDRTRIHMLAVTEYDTQIDQLTEE
jgi:uncharacterized protein (TIGR02118 family)